MRIVVVDDEPLSRQHLENVLRSEPCVEVVASCSNAAEAAEAIVGHDPDALFLDIEMPGCSGLDLARDVDAAGRPLVVFVTAHQRYAVEAFDVSPVDYVLKPAERLRCRRALARIARILNARAGTTRPKNAPVLSRVFVKQDDRLVHIPTAEMDVLEALGNYVKIRSAGQTYILRISLSALESRLDPALFVRTHRSYIVNVTRIRELVAMSHGDYRVVMTRGGTAPLSRVYREKLEMFVVAARQDDEERAAARA